MIKIHALTPVIVVLIILISYFTFLPINSQTVEPRARLVVKVNEEVTEVHIIISAPISNKTETYFLVLPFAINSVTSSYPFNCLSPFDIIQDKFTLFTIITPPGTSQIEINTETKNLVISENDWNEIRISFQYSDTPESIKQVLNCQNTIKNFERIEFTFGLRVDQEKIIDSPIASNVTDNTRVYEGNQINKVGDFLTIRYPVNVSFWYIEVSASAIIGIAAAFGLAKVQIPKKKRRYLLLVPFIFTGIWAIYSSILLCYKGIEWDSLSKYYPAVLEAFIGMTVWLPKIISPKKRKRTVKHEAEEEIDIDSIPDVNKEVL